MTTIETLLLQVDIVANNARLAELSKEARLAKEEFAKLQAQVKAGQVSAEALDSASVKLKATLAANAQETRVLTAANAAQVRAVQASEGSIEQLRAQLALGTAAYNKLSAAERDNTEAGQKLQANNKMLSDNLKVLEKAVGDTRRNVGNYKDSVIEAAKESGLFGGITDRVAGAQEKFNAVQTVSKAVIGETSGALGILKIAFLALPIFAVIAALGVLYTFFTKTVEGGQLVETVFAQISAAINVAIDRAGIVGKAVKQLLEGDFSGAANSARLAMAGFGDEIAREVKLSGDLSKARQQLDRDTVKNIDTNKRLLNEVERLKNVRDNEFNTIQVRQKANEDAYKAELQRESTLADLARRRIDLLKSEIDLRGGESKVSLEQLRAFKEAQNELSDIQEDAAGKQNELITNRFQLNKELLEQQAKLREDAIKNRIATIQTELVAVKAGSDRELELRQQLIREMAALEKAGADKTAADKRLIMAKALQDELKLDEDFDKARQERARKFLDDQDKGRAAEAAAEKKRKDDATKESEDAYAQNERLLQRNLDRRAATLEQDYADGKVSKENYEKNLENLEEAGLGARIVLQKNFNKDSAQLETQLAKTQGNARRAAEKKDKQSYEERARLAIDFGQQVGQLFADTLTDTGQTLQDFAAKVLILILDGLEKAALASAAEAVIKSVGTNPTPAGIIQGAVSAALITAAFEAVKGALSASSAQPFNTGGIVPGGGPNKDSTLTYLTPGEVVITREAAQANLPLLSHLNSLYGGTSFAPGFNPQVATSDGGLIARQIGAAQPIDYQQLAATLAKVQLNVGVRTIEDAKASYSKPRGLTTLGGKG